MNRQEAARYARWSAGAAIAIVVLVVAVYLHRRMSGRVARQELPPPVPASVEQQSAQFTYSRMIGPRALFTVHASRATEYIDQNRSLLEDVAITIFGRKGDRDDTVSARECSYLPKTEQIRCQGTVQIDLRDTKTSGKASAAKMHLETRDISFNRNGEEVSTPNDVTLEFPGGKGQGNGLLYDTKTEIVKLERNVQLQITRNGMRAGTPTAVHANSLEYERRAGVMRLSGPVLAQQDGRQYESGSLEVRLDAEMHPRNALANGGARLKDAARNGAPFLAAHRLEVDLGAAGNIQRVVGEGDVHARRNFSKGTEGFSAQRTELTFAIVDRTDRPRELLATGNVQVDSQQDGVSRRLTTEGLRMEFDPAAGRRGAGLASAETTTPAEIVFSQPEETDRIRAGIISANFNPQSRLEKLNGSTGVEASRQIDAGVPQETSAQNLTATFAGAKDWETIEESGGVKFRQGNRAAQADREVIDRNPSEMTLDGNAMVGDPSSITSAAHIEINQATGAIRASGSVVSSYLVGANWQPPSSVHKVTHVSADRLEAANKDGHAIYSGRARMWQGDSVLDADTIELWQKEKKIEARGSVQGVFPESPGKTATAANKPPMKTGAPILWQVRAPLLDYWGGTGRVELRGGVQAQSANGSISSRTLEILLSGDATHQRIVRATASGNVRIAQNGRVGTADKSVYTADQGKFVLSGGLPTVSDPSGNTTTGRELTFFLASDTILVGSQKGSRTITKHRVEK